MRNCYASFLMVVGVAAAMGCESPCKPGFQRYGNECVRSPDAGTGEDERDSGSEDRADGNPTGDADAATACMGNACGGCSDIADAEKLGMPCEAGKGNCKKAGAWVCDGKDALKCSAVADAPGSEECGGGDEDCDGKVNETSLAEPALRATAWFADCDGDGFLVAQPLSISNCGFPALSPSECNDARAVWRSSPPNGPRDCADSDPRAFPGQTAHFGTAIQGSDKGYDFDCDGAETPNFSVPGITHINNNGCDSRAQAWIIADNDDAQTCYDAQSGYGNACGTTPFTIQRGFLNESEVGPLRCGGPGAVICDSGYGVPIVCR